MRCIMHRNNTSTRDTWTDHEPARNSESIFFTYVSIQRITWELNTTVDFSVAVRRRIFFFYIHAMFYAIFHREMILILYGMKKVNNYRDPAVSESKVSDMHIFLMDRQHFCLVFERENFYFFFSVSAGSSPAGM